MPTLPHAGLSVAMDDNLTEATVRVVCNVEFSEFEVNAMNLLGLRYTVRCRVINRDLWYETTALEFDDIRLPHVGKNASTSEEVVFDTTLPADALREHMFTREQFIAELQLIDTEAGAEQVVRSETVTVDMAV